MRLVINNNRSQLLDINTSAVALASSSFEGRKMWKGSRQLTFETSEHNLRIARGFALDGERDDRAKVDPFVGHELTSSWQKGSGTFDPVLKPHDFQLDAYEKLKRLHVFALFAEPGTGKTKIFTDILCSRAHENLITGVLIFAYPKGVHHQWVDEQLPQHMWKSVPYKAVAWDGKTLPDWANFNNPNRIEIVTANIEMLISPKGRQAVEDFVATHRGKLLINVDESQCIKNKSSKRHKYLSELCEGEEQRAIMTGTPIAKDLTDEWSQFYFLDPSIIGHRYKTTFHRQFCIMGGYEMRSVIGHRNLEKFKALTEPYIFRITKQDALDLPPKVYDKVIFDMSKEQKKHQKSLRDSFIMALESGEMSTVDSAVVAMTRLQQLSCGYIVDDEGQVHDLKENPRLEACKQIVSQRQGKIIIWCRFNRDADFLTEAFGERSREMVGRTPDKQRKINRADWLREESGVDILIAKASVIGAGHNLQGLCRTAIYYSNSFNAIERWQSEDRIHRDGTTGTVTYFDLVARDSIDAKILRSLKDKKSISSMVLDDVKDMFNELE